LKQAYRHVSVLGKNQVEGRKLYSLVGNLPDSFDRLVAKGRMLPKIEPGEYCVVHDVGCGGRSMPMLYGLRPVAAEFLYEQDGTIRQISKRRSEKEVLDFLTAW
jgi:diaminopimelate decarboxylase